MSNAPFDICIDQPSAALLEVAHKELRETPEIREQAIKELRELLHEAKELNYGDSDEFLLIFLRPCKFYPKSALELVSKDDLCIVIQVPTIKILLQHYKYLHCSNKILSLVFVCFKNIDFLSVNSFLSVR